MEVLTPKPSRYHDFLMSETGIDAPLHVLSLDQVTPRFLDRPNMPVNSLSQFMYISKEQSASADLPSLAEKRYIEKSGDQLGAGYKPRSSSLNVGEQSRAKGLVERMKHTLEFKLNEPTGFSSFKGNIRNEQVIFSYQDFPLIMFWGPEIVSAL